MRFAVPEDEPRLDEAREATPPELDPERVGAALDEPPLERLGAALDEDPERAADPTPDDPLERAGGDTRVVAGLRDGIARDEPEELRVDGTTRVVPEERLEGTALDPIPEDDRFGVALPDGSTRVDELLREGTVRLEPELPDDPGLAVDDRDVDPDGTARVVGAREIPERVVPPDEPVDGITRVLVLGARVEMPERGVAPVRGTAFPDEELDPPRST